MEKRAAKGNYSVGRNYGAERKMGRIGGFARKFGAEMGKMGKETFRGGPSSQERMEKMGYDMTFQRPFGKKWTAPPKAVESYIEASKNFARHEKDAIRQMIKNTVPEKQWSPKQRGLSQKDMEEAFQTYEKKFGSKVADEFRRAVGLGEGKDPKHSQFAGGRQRKMEDVLKDLQRAKGRVGKWRMPYAEQVIKGLQPKYQKYRKTFDQPKAYAVREEIGKTFGPKVQAKFDRTFQAEQFGQQKEQTQKGASPKIDELQAKRGRVVVSQDFKNQVSAQANALGRKIGSLIK